MAREFNMSRRDFVRDAGSTLAATRLALWGVFAPQLGCAGQAAAEPAMPSLAGATGWLNSPPLTPETLRGKVVLVQFCTYTCINWLRTLPYVRAWARTYAGRGLVVLGVHTPEFEFEKNPANVRRALAAMGIGYPIALDADYGVWRAFGNHYWPALYLVDARGHLRHQHFGEGEYEQTEKWIQRLLAEAGAAGALDGIAQPEITGIELSADEASLRTPETYLGHARADAFASPGGVFEDERHIYAIPSALRLNRWALAGEWSVGPQAVVLGQPGGRIAHQFHARDLHLVMGAADAASPARFRVRIDGAPPGEAHGGDVDARGEGRVAEPRLYQLVRQHGRIEDRRFEIEFLDAGVQAYAFTFG
jgi:hypothetical protein